MNKVWDLCKLLNNPKKVKLLMMICMAGGAGVTVKDLVSSMKTDGLKNSGVSQYLKQFLNLGVVRRERRESLVYYCYDLYRAREEVGTVLDMIRERFRSNGDMSFLQWFRGLMNPFRAKVANYLALGGNGAIEEICGKFGCAPVLVREELRIGVEMGMFGYDGAGYRLQLPADPILEKVVELSKV